jgi:denticleless
MFGSIHSYTLPLSVHSDASMCNQLSHPGLFVNSFYVKLAISPCGSWLASGSSGGGIYLWDVASRPSHQRKAVELKSAGQEVSAVDWAGDMVHFILCLVFFNHLIIL